MCITPCAAIREFGTDSECGGRASGCRGLAHQTCFFLRMLIYAPNLRIEPLQLKCFA